MEHIRMFLCPHVPMDKIVKRAGLIKNQLRKEAQSDIVPMIPNIQPYKCQVCQNMDESTMILDDNQGTMICLGADRLGCGGVVLENRWSSNDAYWEGHPDEYYSPQASFTSSINNHKYQRLNNMIEKNISRYQKEDTITEDQYKDFHRDEAYGILDQVGILSLTIFR